MQTGLILLPGNRDRDHDASGGKILQKHLITSAHDTLGFVSFSVHLSAQSDARFGGNFLALIFRGSVSGSCSFPWRRSVSGLKGKDIPQGARMTNMMQ